MTKVCPECNGYGTLWDGEGGYEEPCPECNGWGEIEQPTGNEKLTRSELDRP